MKVGEGWARRAINSAVWDELPHSVCDLLLHSKAEVHVAVNSY